MAKQDSKTNRTPWIIFGLILCFLVYIIFFNDFSTNDELIGGQTDEYGCLGPAGYSYDSYVGACVRNWELSENTKDAAKIAVDYYGFKKGLTVIDVDVFKCIGCFDVTLNQNTSTIVVSLANWVPTLKKE